MVPLDYSACSLDDLIRYYIAGEDPLRRGLQALATEIQAQSSAVIKFCIRRRLDLSQAGEGQLFDDALTLSLERLWNCLGKARNSGDTGLIRRNAAGLVMAIATAAISDIVSRGHPEYEQLADRLRYMLSNADKHGMVKTWYPGGGRYGLPRSETRTRNCWDEREFRSSLAPIEPGEMELPELVRRIIGWHGRDMNRQEIMRCLGDLMLKYEQSTEAGELTDESLGEAVSGSGADVDYLIEQMSWLWSEILELPGEQRKAILFRMEAEGLCALADAAGYEALARSMEIEPVELVRMLPDLPLDYEKIGSITGLTAQQARSRRARGWNRIERRYRHWRSATGVEHQLMERWIALLTRKSEAVVGELRE